MIRLSLCMIVKNEEAVLTRVLASAIQFADEILVADTGSTDRTVEIARQYTKHIYHYPWNDDFAAARNFICEKVSTEYWIWLDADDIVPAESITAILKLKETLSKSPQPDVVMMKYVAGFQPDGTSAFTYNRERTGIFAGKDASTKPSRRAAGFSILLFRSNTESLLLLSPILTVI